MIEIDIHMYILCQLVPSYVTEIDSPEVICSVTKDSQNRSFQYKKVKTDIKYKM